MKLFFKTLISILFTYKAFSGELIWESFGTDNMSSIFQYEEGKTFIVYNNKYQHTTNLGVNGVGNCSGIIEITDKQSMNIMCETNTKFGKYFIRVMDVKAGDMSSNAAAFEFLSGEGIWKEFVGIECLGAYYQMPENHYMWKGKCKVPDATINRVKNIIAEKS